MTRKFFCPHCAIAWPEEEIDAGDLCPKCEERVSLISPEIVMDEEGEEHG